MRIAIIDGQGGGIGKLLVERIKDRFGEQVTVLAMGTNSLATSLMMRSGADEGATGENAIRVNAPKVDIIIGSVGILSANAMLGELTPAMAEAIGASPAKKILIPLNRCNLMVTGTGGLSLPAHVDEAVECIGKELALHNERI
jgi:hypothetical protein